MSAGCVPTRRSPSSENAGFRRWLQIFGADRVFAMEACFDESGTHGSRFLCVAGYLFTTSGAIRFAERWTSELIPMLPGVGHFHAADCGTRRGPYHQKNANERDAIVERAADIIGDTASFGGVVGIDPSDYELVTSRDPRIRKSIGSAYTLCAIRCIQLMSNWADSQSLDESIAYQFEVGCRYAGELANSLAAIERNKTLKKQYHLRGFAFLDKEEMRPLEAADLLAWEWQRAHLTATQTEHEGRKWRPTLKQLASIPHQPLILTSDSLGVDLITNAFHDIDGSGRRRRRQYGSD